MSEASLVGAMADFGLQRRRRSFPPVAVKRELSSVKQWFLTPGQTAKSYSHLFGYLMASLPRSRRARKNDVRGNVMREILAHVRAWLLDESVELSVRRQVIREAADYGSKCGFMPIWNGINVHDKNLSAEERRARQRDLSAIRFEHRRLTGFFDLCDERCRVQDARTFVRSMGSMLRDIEDSLVAAEMPVAIESGRTQGMLF